MSQSGISQVKNLQDKTSLRGAYFFLAFSLMYLIFSAYPDFGIDPFNDPYKNLGFYIVILSISSIIAGVLYFLQIEILLFKFFIKHKSTLKFFREYGDVKLSSCIDHTFIMERKKDFFSKLLFTLALILLILAFIITKTSNPEFINNEIYLIILIVAVIVIGLLFIWVFLFDLKELINSMKFIFFMKLLLQDNNLAKEEIIKKFIDNIRNNLWFEAKQAFTQFINGYLNSLCEPYFKKLEFQKTLKLFTRICFDIDKNIAQWEDKQIKAYIMSDLIEKYDYFPDVLTDFKNTFDYFINLIEITSNRDKWLNFFAFFPNRLHLEIYNFGEIRSSIVSYIKQLKIVMDKGGPDPVIENAAYDLYAELFKKWSSRKATEVLIYVLDYIFNIDNFKIILDNLRNLTFNLHKKLKLQKRLENKDHQKIFDAFNDILYFYINNYNKSRYDHKSSIQIVDEINVLRLYEYDLDKLDILCLFQSEDELIITINSSLQITIILRTVVKNIFQTYVFDMKQSVDFLQYKDKICEVLKTVSEKHNLKVKNSKFWFDTEDNYFRFQPIRETQDPKKRWHKLTED